MTLFPEHKGLHDQAIADFTKAIELKPDLVEAYNNRGAAYGSKELYDQAIADFTKASDKAIAAYRRSSLPLNPDMKAAQDGLKHLGGN